MIFDMQSQILQCQQTVTLNWNAKCEKHGCKEFNSQLLTQTANLRLRVQSMAYDMCSIVSMIA